MVRVNRAARGQSPVSCGFLVGLYYPTTTGPTSGPKIKISYRIIMENSKDYKGVAVKDVETGSDLRKRAWVMVINNYTEKDEAKFRLMASKATYAIFGREVAPTTGTKHMQCFMYFGNKRRWTTLHKFFDNAWIAPARGTPQQNFVYCSEDGDYEQYGELPTQGRAK